MEVIELASRSGMNVMERVLVRETPAERFAKVCAAGRTRLAVTCDGRHVTYAELDEMAEAVAEELTGLGAGPGRLVAIVLERGVEMVAAMLGVAKTGAAYLPIDPGYPAARIAETIEDAGPMAVVSSAGIRARSEAGWVDERAAYVIYTSGSTGRPKGVVVSCENLMRLFDATEHWFGFGVDDVWSVFHSFAFDFSVWELWGALLTGGRAVLVPFAVSRNPGEFWELLRREGVSVLSQTPTAFGLLDAVDEDRSLAAGLGGREADSLPSLRVVVFGGEALGLGSLRGWVARHGDARPALVNMYGITETTVHVTYRRVLARDLEERESLIGVAIPDMTVHLLGERLRPVTDGEEGEICVGGAGVALGYLGRPELTAERFVDGGELGRLYRSGDMGRMRADGELIYLGRRDGQVKIAGFRIETGEVEAALLGCNEVRQACVVASNGRLIAFVVGETAGLATALALSLPAQMRPAAYHAVSELSLTLNGKVDRQHLLSRLQSGRDGLAPVSSSDAPGLVTEPASGFDPMAVSGYSEAAATTTERVALVWQRVLQLGEVGLDENFFDAGGSSLLLVAMRAGLQAEFGREIPLMWVFECTTIRALATRLDLGTGPSQMGEPFQTREVSNARHAAAENAMRAKQSFGRAKARSG